MSIEFVFRLLCDKSPWETSIGPDGPKSVDLWLFGQLAPLMTLGWLKFVPSFVEDLVLHTFPVPFFLVKSKYKKIYDAFYESAGLIFDEAEELGIKRDEACHNLNAYGGMKTVFPALMKWVGAGGEDLHRRLAAEIRAAAGVSMTALNEMRVTKSVVYEVLRIEPSVPYQYGKAKHDFKIRNHENSFLIKKGEMLFGYQPIATKDPRIFDNPDEFVAEGLWGWRERSCWTTCTGPTGERATIRRRRTNSAPVKIWWCCCAG